MFPKQLIINFATNKLIETSEYEHPIRVSPQVLHFEINRKKS